MNTPRPFTMSTATGQPFHSSVRTSVSLNTDATTGERSQVMTTSRLELCWVAGELRLQCRASRTVLSERPAALRGLRRLP